MLYVKRVSLKDIGRTIEARRLESVCVFCVEALLRIVGSQTEAYP